MLIFVFAFFFSRSLRDPLELALLELFALWALVVDLAGDTFFTPFDCGLFSGVLGRCSAATGRGRCTGFGLGRDGAC